MPAWQPFGTSYGPLTVREFGPHDGPLVFAVHGVTDNNYIREEWNPTALQLAADGFHVLLPDFHSAPAALRPSAMTGDVFRQLVAELALHHDGFVPQRYRTSAPPKMAVLGKSWGAQMAAEAAQLPQVVAAALVVPAFSERTAEELLPKTQCEVALFMVEDDDVAPISNGPTFLELLGPRGHWTQAASGGHRILAEFVEPIATFLERARDSFVHGGEEL